MNRKNFAFKQFVVSSGNAGMPVSTDGVMLGAWADIEVAQTVLDIGTGTGLLALMCAQRNKKVKITALDLDVSAMETAKNNVENSPWKARIQLINADILSYRPLMRFDHIICNPPYFNHGLIADNLERAMARHSYSLPHDALIQHCKTLLSPSGKASFILPLVEGEAFLKLAELNDWFVSRLCYVKATENKDCKRILFELMFDATGTEETELVIHDKTQPHGYSQAFVHMCQAFYLKM